MMQVVETTTSVLIRIQIKHFCSLLRNGKIHPYVYSKRHVSVKSAVNYENEPRKDIGFPQPVYDMDYYCNPINKREIQENIKIRKSRGDINLVLNIHDQLSKVSEETSDFVKLREKLLSEVGKLPNKLHESIKILSDKPKVVNNVGVKKEFGFKPKEFSDISKNLRVLRNDHLSNFTDHRSYFFMGQLAQMESALIRFTLKNLLAKNFQLISVPDILDKRIIESCGMDTEGERTQVYTLDSKLYGEGLCLSGTSEMAIAGFLMNKTFSINEVPLRLAAVSRCYRAETSRISEEKGIYRVHQFTKVEMFGVSQPEKSDEILEEFREIEESLFGSLGLHLQTLDMPPSELGNQACKKYDVEAWMPGKEYFGEVSSCSNCTDYQSRRLNIKLGNDFVHTLNGTACAVPRLIIAILENNQNKDGTVNIPTVLQPYMSGETLIKLNRNIPKMKPYFRKS